MKKFVFQICLLLLFHIQSVDGFVISPKSYIDSSSLLLHMTRTSKLYQEYHEAEEKQSNTTQTRRKLIQQSTIATVALTLLPIKESQAASTTTTSTSQLLDTQASKFKRVPLFAIVNGSSGTPFMILQNTGKAQAYFFTTYDGAQSVLDDARRDAADKGFETKDMWDNAKISAVNLEFALKLGTGKPKALAQNNVKYDTVYDVIPSVKSLTDAERIDKSGMYSERGRVPLFYSTEFTIGPEKEGGPNRIPVFLEKNDLLREYTKKFPEKEDLFVTVVDLMDTFSTMMGNKPIGAKVDEKLVNNFFIVPTMESRKKAVECEKERGSTSAYKIGEIIAVGGK